MLEYAAFPIFDHSFLVLCFLIDASGGGKSMKPSQRCTGESPGHHGKHAGSASVGLDGVKDPAFITSSQDAHAADPF